LYVPDKKGCLNLASANFFPRTFIPVFRAYVLLAMLVLIGSLFENKPNLDAGAWRRIDPRARYTSPYLMFRSWEVSYLDEVIESGVLRMDIQINE